MNVFFAKKVLQN